MKDLTDYASMLITAANRYRDDLVRDNTICRVNPERTKKLLEWIEFTRPRVRRCPFSGGIVIAEKIR
jgi:hypothetical protein